MFAAHTAGLRRLIATSLLAASGVAAVPAWSIVSERHLRGISALDCDLEGGTGDPARTFRLLVHAREHQLQLDGAADRFPYEEASDSSLRFRLPLNGQSALECELELPAGALACADPKLDARKQRLGLCLRAP